MKWRIISIITALALCLSLCPTWAFAADVEKDTAIDENPSDTTIDNVYGRSAPVL